MPSPWMTWAGNVCGFSCNPLSGKVRQGHDRPSCAVLPGELYGIAIECFRQDEAQHAAGGIAPGMDSQHTQSAVFVACSLHHQTIGKATIEHVLEFSCSCQMAKMLEKPEGQTKQGSQQRRHGHLCVQIFHGNGPVNEPLCSEPPFMQQAKEEKENDGQWAFDAVDMAIEASEKKV